jgi:hypothetical protein
MSEISTSPTMDPSPTARDRLTRAIAEAEQEKQFESPVLCDAVEAVVEEAKEAGAPPERVIVMLKRIAVPLLEAGRLPVRAMQALVAWIVRCAVKAYYRQGRPEGSTSGD